MRGTVISFEAYCAGRAQRDLFEERPPESTSTILEFVAPVSLNARQVDHRRRMLKHLGAVRPEAEITYALSDVIARSDPAGHGRY